MDSRNDDIVPTEMFDPTCDSAVDNLGTLRSDIEVVGRHGCERISIAAIILRCCHDFPVF